MTLDWTLAANVHHDFSLLLLHFLFLLLGWVDLLLLSPSSSFFSALLTAGTGRARPVKRRAGPGRAESGPFPCQIFPVTFKFHYSVTVQYSIKKLYFEEITCTG